MHYNDNNYCIDLSNRFPDTVSLPSVPNVPNIHFVPYTINHFTFNNTMLNHVYYHSEYTLVYLAFDYFLFELKTEWKIAC